MFSVLCSTFECFSSFLEWELWLRAGLKSTAHYLHDFIVCGEKGSELCRFLLGTFQSLAGELGLLLVEKKTKGLASTLTFLGIEIDTQQQFCQLPANKLVDVRARLRYTAGLKKVTLRELQEVVVILNLFVR